MLQQKSLALYPDCPIRNVLSRVSGKWPMLVLHSLENKSPMRFSELRREIKDASPKMLTETLRTLEEDGIIFRRVYPCVPPKVEYELTNRGNELLRSLEPLVSWAITNMPVILRERMARVNQA